MMNNRRLLLLLSLQAHDLCLISGRLGLKECPEEKAMGYFADGDGAKYIWEGKAYLTQIDVAFGFLAGSMVDCAVLESKIGSKDDPTNSNHFRWGISFYRYDKWAYESYILVTECDPDTQKCNSYTQDM